MALINCPACNSRISSKSEHCSSCNAPIAANNDEASDRANERASWKRRKRQQNYAFLAILSFVTGVALFWQFRDDQTSTAFKAGIWLGVTGFFGYAALRIMGIWNRFK
jgi:predicted nucleic acid-binding Zn ribbon protein